MAENRIVKFCARVGQRSISLVVTNCLPGGPFQRYVVIFWQLSVNIPKTVQDREILSRWKTNRKSYIACQMAITAVTLINEWPWPVAGLFKRNPSNICAAFYTISTDSVLARFLSLSRASCLLLLTNSVDALEFFTCSLRDLGVLYSVSRISFSCKSMEISQHFCDKIHILPRELGVNYAVIVCLSVRRPSQVGVLQRRLNLGSHK